MLAGGSRTALPRQQILDALVAWNCNLLSETEQRLFQQLAVFIGPSTPEAAKQVCSDETVAEFDVLDLLPRLVDKSLVITEDHPGETYYRLLETLRQDGQDRMILAEEAKSLSNRHAQYFLKMVDAAEKELHGPKQLLGFRRIGVLQDNLCAGLQRLIDMEQNMDAFTFATCLEGPWMMRGDNTETQPLAEAALSAAHVHEDLGNVAFTLYVLALFEDSEGNSNIFQEISLESVRSFRDLHDDWQLANASIVNVRTRKLLEAAFQSAGNLGDQYLQSTPLQLLCFHYFDRGNIKTAMNILKQAMSIAISFDHKISITTLIIHVAGKAWVSGHPIRAVVLYGAGRTSMTRWVPRAVMNTTMPSRKTGQRPASTS